MSNQDRTSRCRFSRVFQSDSNFKNLTVQRTYVELHLQISIGTCQVHKPLSVSIHRESVATPRLTGRRQWLPT